MLVLQRNPLQHAICARCVGLLMIRRSNIDSRCLYAVYPSRQINVRDCAGGSESFLPGPEGSIERARTCMSDRVHVDDHLAVFDAIHAIRELFAVMTNIAQLSFGQELIGRPPHRAIGTYVRRRPTSPISLAARAPVSELSLTV